MQFILKLLKEVLNRLSNIYKKEFVDGLLSTKVSVEDSEEVIDGLASERSRADEFIQGSIDSCKAYDEALSNVIKWQSYAAAMQSMVDDETAIQIAEEFEKAAEEYLKDPSVTEVVFTKDDSPYFVKENVVIDFRPVVTSGYSDTDHGVATGFSLFSSDYKGIIFFSNLSKGTLMLNSGGQDGSLFFYSLSSAPLGFLFSRRYANPSKGIYYVYAPNANYCGYLFYVCTNAVEISMYTPSYDSGYGCFFNCTNLKRLTARLDSVRIFDSSFFPKYKKLYYMRVYAPSLVSAKNALIDVGLDAESIKYLLDSLGYDPVGRGGNGIITFSGCPGIASVATTESFIVTDDDGVEYTMDNCPIFINDDDDQSLRKAVALSVMKKGWTVEGDTTYTQSEYLEFTGTQYIDTGIVGNLDTSYEIVFDTDVVLSDHMVLFGSRESASSRSISTMVHTASRSILTDFGDYTNTRQAYTAFKPTTLYKVYNSKNNRSVYDYETNLTTSVATSYTSSFTTPTNLFIGYKSSGYTAEDMSNFSGRVFGCKIWQAGVLVRDLIPVVDNDGVAGMYDKVSRATFTSSGTPFITPTIE